MTRTMQRYRASRTYRTYRSALPVIAAALMTFRIVEATEREVEVEVRTVQPQAVTGRLISFSLQDGAVVQTGTEKRQIPTTDIIRMTKRVTTPQDVVEAEQRDRESWTITLTWGDVLSGRLIGAHEDSDNETVRRADRVGKVQAGAPVVVMETADLREVAIPIEAVARIASARAASSIHRESLQWLDRGRSTDHDQVLLTNGDVLRGFISAIEADGIVIDTGTGPTTAPFRLVVAARLAPAVPADPTAKAMGHPPQPYMLLTLRDGARLTATGLDWSEVGGENGKKPKSQNVEVKLRIGATVRVDADRIVALEVIGGRWEWLSDHRPISYEQAPMLGPGWEYLSGRNVLSGPILVAGERYERGIGVHSRSNLIFELNGEYREFVTSFGMDDDSGPLADVTIVLLVDGQRRFEKAHVRRGALFGPVRVDVLHAGRIELIVEYGDNGDLQDRFDWIEPGLVR